MRLIGLSTLNFELGGLLYCIEGGTTDMRKDPDVQTLSEEIFED